MRMRRHVRAYAALLGLASLLALAAAQGPASSAQRRAAGLSPAAVADRISEVVRCVASR